MNISQGTHIGFQDLQDLKAFLAAEGPCLSVYMQLGRASREGLSANARQNELHWKECLRALESSERLGSEGRKLLESVRNWNDVVPEEATDASRGSSIAVFRAPGVARACVLAEEVSDRAVLGSRFYVRPLLRELVRDQAFYLLALSQKNTRLLSCTRHNSEEVTLPAEIKTSFEEWMNQTKPDHTAVKNAMAAGRQGFSGPTALAPKGADAEAKNRYLAHFFGQIGRGVSEALRGKSEALVLCAVEYEVPIYREVNSYPHLACEEVRGAPNSLKSGEMHARALDVLERCYLQKVDAEVAEWKHRVGGGASSRLKDIVAAAHDGRVKTLLISETQEQAGVFNETTHTAKGVRVAQGEEEDLVNDAAVQTVLHAGDVLVAPDSKMPDGSAAAAIFRY
jgi:hypothetical protein